jgi:hypothetical protein
MDYMKNGQRVGSGVLNFCAPFGAVVEEEHMKQQHGDESRGEVVIVRAHQGRALVRRVWSVSRNRVYITNDEQLNRLLAGREALWPLGFPREDVFKYDSEIAANLDAVNWSRLTRWTPAAPPQ